ncbi:MAG: ABC transporter permease [Pseudomonadota bacterium]
MKQAAYICLATLQSIWGRWNSALVTVFGVALVVAVLASTLMMSQGIEAQLTQNARADWHIVLRQGAVVESMSDLAPEVQGAIAQAMTDLPEVVLQRHLVSSVVLPRLDSDASRAVGVRGLTSDARIQSPGFRLVDGRGIRSGAREVLVGALVGFSFASVGLDDEVEIGGVAFKVVGIFEAQGMGAAELWADLPMLMDALGRTSISSLRIYHRDGDVAQLQARLADHDRLRVEVTPEVEFFTAQSSMRLFAFVATAVSLIMAFGATLGAMNLMFIAVDARRLEVATLRALGFGPGIVTLSILFESLLLTLLGGLFGLGFCVLVFEGTPYIAGSMASITTLLTMTPQIALTGLLWAGVVGCLAGIPAAWRGVRVPIYEGLRAP